MDDRICGNPLFMSKVSAKVLVVGGAGYVGSVTCAWLIDAGHDVWVLDNLSSGHRELALGTGFTFGRAGDKALVSELIENQKFDCVMHFAAKSLVGESLSHPTQYFENNVLQTQKLLDVLLKGGQKNFIFSSTCAVFGDPGDQVIHEGLERKPMNPYGETKLEVEKMLQNLSIHQGLRAIVLRYFNAAGADPQLRVGESHDPETHLIPRVLKAAVQKESVEIYGTDYSTPDGTCIRDYVHVWDLAAAHGAAMDRLLSMESSQSGSFEAYNLGSGTGFSVRQVIQACEEVTGQTIAVVERGRRLGDPEKLVADSSLAERRLGFKQNKNNIKSIISSAWEWEKRNSAQFRKAIFLDRDGTLNEDPGYLSDPEQLKLLPHVGEGLALLKAAGYLLVVISNQSGVARGLIQLESLSLIHDRLDDLLSPWDVKIDCYEFCIHHPKDECECRKPKPKLILEVAQRLKIDVSMSYMVGDRASDLEAGALAGCRATLLVKTGGGQRTALELDKAFVEKMGEPTQPAFIGESLLQVAHWILKHSGRSLGKK